MVVKDPLKPPTQDNIRQIVEMKFPPDSLTEPQLRAYIRIAGGSDKVATLEPSDCDCQDSEPKSPHRPVEELGAAAAVEAWITFILTRGKSPRPPLTPRVPIVRPQRG